MTNNSLVSIGLHTGKSDYVVLLENLLKSILVCNEYTNLEIVLIESAGNKDIRSWIDELDLNEYFVNFDGTKTDISKRTGVRIKKTTMYLDYPDDLMWYQCYSDAMRNFFEKCSGEYCFMLAEDNQFFLSGDVITDCIDILKKYGVSKTMVNFSTLQIYKYFKKNNQVKEMSKMSMPDSGEVNYFLTKFPKWDPTYFCHKEIFKMLGPFSLSDEKNPHRTIEYFSERANKLGLKRVFLSVPQNVWFPNDKRDRIIAKIKKGCKIDPNFVLLNTHDKETIRDQYSKSEIFGSRPIASEDVMGLI